MANFYHLIDNETLQFLDERLQRNIAKLQYSLNDYLIKSGGLEKLTEGQRKSHDSRAAIITDLMTYHETNLQFNNDRELYIQELQNKIRALQNEINEIKIENVPKLLTGTEIERRRFNSISQARAKWADHY